MIPAPIDRVWAVVRDFDRLPAWHPAIGTSTLESGSDGQCGSVRRLTLGDGGVVTERLVSLDDDEHRLVYTIIECPFAVRRYVSTMHLSPITETGETFMEWFAEYDGDAADEEQLNALFGDGVFGGGLKGLKRHLGQGDTA
ncbi:SRPBCC family protein [Jatrophihabitans fulvus]